MTTDPLVTVVVPAYNAERFVAAAVQSVLAQTYPRVEVVVIDDGSTDGTRGVVAEFGAAVRYYPQQHAGAAVARNHGIDESRGAYIGFLDADDIWRPRKLEWQLAEFAHAPRPDLVFGLVDHFADVDLDGGGGGPAPGPLLPGHLISALLAPAQAVRRVGAFAPELRTGEFIDWMARAMDLGLKFVTPPVHVASRRVHDANFTRLNPETRGDLPRILKASLDRRRRKDDRCG